MKSLGGSFSSGPMMFRTTLFGRAKMLMFSRGMRFGWDRVPVEQLTSVRIVDRNEAPSWTGKIASALTGELMFGTAGAVVGLMRGGNRDETLAELTFADGRVALVKATRREVEKLMAVSYQQQAKRGAIAS